jgi:hypothetical protein
MAYRLACRFSPEKDGELCEIQHGWRFDSDRLPQNDPQVWARAA